MYSLQHFEKEESKVMKSYTHAILCAVAILGIRSEVSGHEIEKLLARSPRIVDGSKVNIENVPWQVSLLAKRGRSMWCVCGGSIISSNWVITAAHCVNHPMLDSSTSIVVSAGSADYRNGSLHTIAEKICHPLYEIRQEATELGVHDIALLRIVEPFVFDRTRQAIPLYSRAHATLSQSLATVSGWGAIDREANHFEFDLKAATMHIISVTECKAFLRGIYNNSRLVPTGQICAKASTGKVCAGDSGGPLIVNGTLVGMDSWRNSTICTDDYPTVFTEVARYRYWISEITLL